jgi:arylsulfatase A-like enzyme
MKVNRRTRGKWTVKHTNPATAKGTHLLHGLWIAAGENIKTDHSFQANIQDMTPTLLTMLEIPVPKDMDGKVLLDLFQHPPQVQYSAAKEIAAPSQDTGYSAEEEEQIQQHLADLGYID